MGFDADKFMGAQFKPREATIKLSALASFFSDGSEPEFTVRGLTGSEFARVQEAPQRYKTMDAIVEGIMTGSRSDAVQAARAMVGLDGEVPGEAVKRIEMLVIGSVEPKLDRPSVVRLAQAFAIEFWQLTNTITVLTGQGHEVGK